MSVLLSENPQKVHFGVFSPTPQICAAEHIWGVGRKISISYTLSPIRRDTMLPGLTSMCTLDPMSTYIHTGIMAITTTPIDKDVIHKETLENRHTRPRMLYHSPMGRCVICARKSWRKAVAAAERRFPV